MKMRKKVKARFISIILKVIKVCSCGAFNEIMAYAETSILTPQKKNSIKGISKGVRIAAVSLTVLAGSLFVMSEDVQAAIQSGFKYLTSKSSVEFGSGMVSRSDTSTVIEKEAPASVKTLSQAGSSNTWVRYKNALYIGNTNYDALIYCHNNQGSNISIGWQAAGASGGPKGALLESRTDESAGSVNFTVFAITTGAPNPTASSNPISTATYRNSHCLDTYIFWAFNDLDIPEEVAIPNGYYSNVIMGSQIYTDSCSTSSKRDGMTVGVDGLVYESKSTSSSVNWIYNDTAIKGVLHIPTTGVTMWYRARGKASSFEVTGFSSVYDHELLYHLNGASGTAPARQYAINASSTINMTVTSTKPTRTGYTFLGWDTNKNATSATYTAGKAISVGTSVTLYAVWKPNTYTIKYNANGGTGTTASSSHTYNVAKALTANGFTRTGYTFLGWSTSSTATSASYSDKQSVTNFTSTNGATVNLYAVWRANTYTNTLAYDANGGSGAPAAQTATVIYPNTAKVFTIPSTKPTREGYTFLGWNTSSTAATAAYNPGGSITIGSNSKTANQSVTLYAVWRDYYEVEVRHYFVNDNDESKAILADKNTVNISVSEFPITDYAPYARDYLPEYKFVRGEVDAESYGGKRIMNLYYYFNGIKVTCIDKVENIATGITVEHVLPEKKRYVFGTTARGSDWGTDSPYDGYAYMGDTQIKVEEEKINSSDFAASPSTIINLK